MKPLLSASLAVALQLLSAVAWAQLASGSLNVRWSAGAKDCAANPQPPLQVHEYNAQTFILRENLCATFEAPFMYLLVGSAKALLIDTGDVMASKQMPLAQTVLGLLPGDGPDAQPAGRGVGNGHRAHRVGGMADSLFSSPQGCAETARTRLSRRPALCSKAITFFATTRRTIPDSR